MDGFQSSGPKSPVSAGQKLVPSSPQNQASFNYASMSPQPFASPSNASPPGGNAMDGRSPPLNQIRGELDSASGGIDGHSTSVPTILMRKLPSSMSHDALRSMLLFAEEFVEARFVPSDNSDDQKYQSAIAQFRTMESAYEARDRLNGKLNATRNATMVVDIVGGKPEMLTERRHTTSEGQAYRQLSTSASSGGSSNGNGRQSSRFNTTFQSLDKMSPTRVPRHMSHGEFSGGDLNAHKQSFVPQSPMGASFGEALRVSGKSVINEDAVDDETGDLLKDPLAYAKSDHSGSSHTDQHPPVSRLAGLSLSTSNNQDGASMMSPPGTGYGSGRPIPQPLHSPISEMSPTGMSNNGMTPLSPTSTFPLSPKFQRHQYPPANPADQNPPCNTLYVGNLPVDTSEDELKAVFSKQRGYKRLCFRTKHNGPMCFVEFEDVSFATKALNELYGHPLHNSVKGGIRLSFSKNPLGVRTGQANAMGPQSPLGSPNNPSGFGNGVGGPPGFSTASGPPPGLSMPPGLSPPMSAGGLSSTTTSGVSQGFFAPNSPPLSSSTTQNASRAQAPVGSFMAAGGGGGYNNLGSNGFPDFMMGR